MSLLLSFLPVVIPVVAFVWTGWNVVRVSKPLALPPLLKCRACEKTLIGAPDPNCVASVRLCYDCNENVKAELERLLPAWFELPLPEEKPQLTKQELVRRLEAGGNGGTGQLVCQNPSMNVVITSGPRRKPLVPECQHCGIEIVYGQMSCIFCEYNGPRPRIVRPKPQMER